jgi:hypothetical protein
MGQLVLAQAVEEVTLVFVLIAAAKEPVPGALGIGILAGRTRL